MKINDRLYGEADLEPVLTDLIHSKAVQRLNGIHQGGACFLVNPAWNISRCEHSIGVMLLIRRLGGSLEEQIAGLLHDVSHTAFSHVADDVFNMENEDYHEQMFRNGSSNLISPGFWIHTDSKMKISYTMKKNGRCWSSRLLHYVRIASITRFATL